MNDELCGDALIVYRSSFIVQQSTLVLEH